MPYILSWCQFCPSHHSELSSTQKVVKSAGETNGFMQALWNVAEASSGLAEQGSFYSEKSGFMLT
jgi:hypothetical protein